MNDTSHTSPASIAFASRLGKILRADALTVLDNQMDIPAHSIDLIVTSPPFALVRQKAYGNIDADHYVDWFRPFADRFYRALKPHGSLVIDIGGAWTPGQPTRSVYHYELLIMLVRDAGFHLAQELFWWNPSKLPTPAEWVTIRRVRVKDAINCLWWLSPTPWPKASNRRVLQPYSDSMRNLLRHGYKARVRPSGHHISTKFNHDNGAAIPSNLLAVPNTESASAYLRYCKARGLSPHPARFPAAIPEYFIRISSNQGDVVLDPFAGSCVTGAVAERLERRWLCIEPRSDYVEGAKGHFVTQDAPQPNAPVDTTYHLPHPGILWNDPITDSPLVSDGGRHRPTLPSD